MKVVKAVFPIGVELQYQIGKYKNEQQPQDQVKGRILRRMLTYQGVNPKQGDGNRQGHEHRHQGGYFKQFCLFNLFHQERLLNSLIQIYINISRISQYYSPLLI